MRDRGQALERLHLKDPAVARGYWRRTRNARIVFTSALEHGQDLPLKPADETARSDYADENHVSRTDFRRHVHTTAQSILPVDYGRLLNATDPCDLLRDSRPVVFTRRPPTRFPGTQRHTSPSDPQTEPTARTQGSDGRPFPGHAQPSTNNSDASTTQTRTTSHARMFILVFALPTPVHCDSTTESY